MYINTSICVYLYIQPYGTVVFKNVIYTINSKIIFCPAHYKVLHLETFLQKHS